MHTLAYLVVWVLAFNVPWQNLVLIEGFGTLSKVIGLVMVLPGVIDMIQRGYVKRMGATFVIMLVFVWLSMLSFLWTPDWVLGQVNVLTNVQLIVMVFLIRQISDDEAEYLGLVQAYVLGTCVLAANVIQIILSGQQLDRITATNFNANEAAFNLVLGIPAAWFLSHRPSNVVPRRLYRLVIPVLAVVVLAIASRGALVALLAAFVALSWGYLRANPIRAVGAIAALTLLVWALSGLVPQRSWDRLTLRADYNDFNGRVPIWEAGLRAWQESPILGVGIGGFSQAASLAVYGPKGAHNTYLAILVEQGLVGFFIMLAFMLSAARLLKQIPTHERVFWIGTLAALFFAGLSDDMLQSKTLWLMIGLLLTRVGLILDFNQRSASSGQDQQRMEEYVRDIRPRESALDLNL